MDDDEFEPVEKKRSNEFTCFSDIHVNSAAVGILLLKISLSIYCIVRYIRIEEYPAAVSLILYSSTMILCLLGYLCSQPKLYFPFIVADIIFKVIFGIFAFGILLFGEVMVQRFELLSKGYYGFPFWFCMFLVIMFFLDVYALNIVCRSQRYLVRKRERSLHRMDTVNPSTDSMHDSIGI